MSDAEPARVSPYDLIGGDTGLRRLTERFYAIMAESPEAAAIRAMHGENLQPVTEKLFGFLRGWMGGPRDYFDRPDSPCIMSLHHRLSIGVDERDQWLACMRRALDEADIPDDLSAMLMPAFARLAGGMASR